MVTTITASSDTLSRADVSTVLGIDLIVILILIGLLILKEFRKYFEQNGLLQQETKVSIRSIVDIAIVPFLYVFCYVLIYKATNIM